MGSGDIGGGVDGDIRGDYLANAGPDFFILPPSAHAHSHHLNSRQLIIGHPLTIMVATRVTRSRTVGNKHPVSDVRDENPKRQATPDQHLSEVSPASPPTTPTTPPATGTVIVIDKDTIDRCEGDLSKILELFTAPGSCCSTAYCYKKILHRAIIEEWGDELFRVILARIGPSGWKNLLSDTSYHKVASSANLFASTTLDFWRAVADRFPDACIADMLNLSLVLADRGHTCFSGPMWEAMVDQDLLNARSSIIDVYWEVCYHRRYQPKWFMDLIIAAGQPPLSVRSLFAPFHYYSTLDCAFMNRWKATRPASMEYTRDLLLANQDKPNSILCDLVEVNSTHVCNIAGFERAHAVMSPVQRAYTDEHRRTGLQKLTHAWGMRACMMIPTGRDMRMAFNNAIKRMEETEAAA